MHHASINEVEERRSWSSENGNKHFFCQVWNKRVNETWQQIVLCREHSGEPWIYKIKILIISGLFLTNFSEMNNWSKLQTVSVIDSSPSTALWDFVWLSTLKTQAAATLQCKLSTAVFICHRECNISSIIGYSSLLYIWQDGISAQISSLSGSLESHCC